MRVTLAALLGSSIGWSAASASAQPLPLDLDWQAPEGCPNAASIRSELTRMTRPHAGKALTSLTARAVVTLSGSTYRLTLETERDGTLNRAQIDGATCQSLARAATLMLALAYGDGVEVLDENEPTADAPPKIAATPAPSISAKPKVLEQPRSQLEIAPWAAATVSNGLVAPAAFGAEAGLRLGMTHWLTVLRVEVIPRVESGSKEAIEVRTSGASIALGGCAQLPLGEVRLAACTSISAGILHASSRGALRDGNASPTLVALMPSVLARYRAAQHWTFHLELGARVPFSRPELVVAGEGVLFRASSVAPQLGAGIELSF